jgi:soluble lytic murein transglycosylase-like protein
MGPVALAGEFAVLRTGYRLHADRHEAEEGKVRLFSNGGVTELPENAVAGFEADDAVASTPALPMPSPAASAPTTSAPSVLATPQEMATVAARKYALPESFVRSVMKAESGFQPGAVSPKGAIGLMQLMPGTARTLGVDPKDPQQNAEGGAQYLRELLAKYESDPDQVLLALAAYNAGPGAVEKYHGVPPYRETREYILRVLKNWDRRQPESPGPATQSSGN